MFLFSLFPQFYTITCFANLIYMFMSTTTKEANSQQLKELKKRENFVVKTIL